MKTKNLSVSLKGLKITNFLIIAKSVEKKKTKKKKQFKPINGLIKNFPNTYKFRNNDIYKFILLLRKVVYPYESMDSLERCNETTLPNKKAFYSKLYLEDITDEDYIYATKAFEEFKLKNLGEYHDLYVQADTLLLAVYLKNLEINVLKYTNIILLIFYLHLD